MTPANPVASPAASELARDAFEQGDDLLLGLRRPGGPTMQRTGRATTGTVTRDLSASPATAAHVRDTRHDDRPPLGLRSDYDAAHDHYLNAAAFQYTGAPRNPHESASRTIARLPESLRDAVRSAHEDFRRDIAALEDGGNEAAILERTRDYLIRIREELATRDPGVFAGRELPAETAPTR